MKGSLVSKYIYIQRNLSFICLGALEKSKLINKIKVVSGQVVSKLCHRLSGLTVTSDKAEDLFQNYLCCSTGCKFPTSLKSSLSISQFNDLKHAKICRIS